MIYFYQCFRGFVRFKKLFILSIILLLVLIVNLKICRADVIREENIFVKFEDNVPKPIYFNFRNDEEGSPKYNELKIKMDDLFYNKWKIRSRNDFSYSAMLEYNSFMNSAFIEFRESGYKGEPSSSFLKLK